MSNQERGVIVYFLNFSLSFSSFYSNFNISFKRKTLLFMNKKVSFDENFPTICKFSMFSVIIHQ